MSRRSGASSAASFLSARSQRKIAALEAEQNVAKMEAEMKREIEMKEDQIAEFQKEIYRMDVTLSRRQGEAMETLLEKDSVVYKDMVEARLKACVEIDLLKMDIDRISKRIQERKKEILDNLELETKKLKVIEEDERGSGSDRESEKSVSSSKTKEVKKWLKDFTMQTASISESDHEEIDVLPPPIPSVVTTSEPPVTSAEQKWKRHEVKNGVIVETEVTPQQINSGNMGQRTSQGEGNFRYLYQPTPLLPKLNADRQRTNNFSHQAERMKTPNVQSGQQYNYQPPPQSYSTPAPVQSMPAEEFAGTLATALAQAFGSKGALSDTQEIVMKKPYDRDLPPFYGDPGEYCNFKAAFERSTKRLNLDEDENMQRMQKALKGDAKKKVSHLMANPSNLNKLMETLEDCFGRPEFVLDYLVEKAKTCSKVELHKPETLVAFGDAVEALVTNVASYNKQDYMSNKQLTKELIDKLPGALKTKWFEWRADDDNRETNLVYFSSWIRKRVKAARLQITPQVKATYDDKDSRNRRDKRGSATVGVAAANEKEKKNCIVCKKTGHSIVNCWDFGKRSNQDKWNLVKAEKLCFLCLQPGHRTNDCKSGNICTTEGCDKKHHLILHYTKERRQKVHKPRNTNQSESEGENEEDKANEGESGPAIATTGAAVVEGTDGALPIIPILLKGPRGKIKTYALLDTGASRSLMENELASELGLEGKDFKFSCRGFGGTLTQHRDSRIVEVDVSGNYRGARYSTIENVITVEKIGVAPYSLNLTEAKTKWPCLRRIKGKSLKQVVPRVIIGSPHRHLTVPREILCSSLGGPVATRTILGWVLEGDLTGKGNSTMFYLGGTAEDLDMTMHQLIKESFKTEDFGIKPTPSRHSLDDMKALQIMKNTTHKIGNRWETGLLWRNEDINLPDSYDDAFKRLLTTEKRMARDKLFHKSYSKKIDEYLSKGFIKKLTPDEVKLKSDRTFYIPHFGVTNPNKPGKFRLVFDAAAKTKGISLNDCLLTGPDLINPLTSVLWNFRRHRIVISGDIEDMFHRVVIREEDRSSQRFLWRDGDSTRDPDVYEMQVMIFGATSSPSSAIYVKNVNAEIHKNEFPEACRAIQEDFYVDDCLSGADGAQEAIKLREDITHVNQEGGFHIKKWISNSKEVMDSIPDDLRLDGARNLTGDTRQNLTERVLGLWWDPQSDHFTFKTNFHKVDKSILNGKHPTKREICSLVMSLYDPLGFIGHYRVKGMIILQHVWNSGVGWDDQVPDEIFEEWLVWVSEISMITTVKIPRCYCVEALNANSVELHTFTDASKEAYAAVCYFRFIFMDYVIVSFVASKVKVAPLKKLTVPRLELQAALLGAKLAESILNKVNINVSSKYYWSDSRTVLSWIRSESARQPEFVGNRIGAIQEITNSSDWKWIPTAENVADDATRVNKNTDFSPGSRWYTGPLFLQLSSDEWPSEKIEEDETTEVLAFSDIFKVSSTVDDGCRQTGEEELAIPQIVRFSSYTRLVRVMTAVLRLSKLWISKVRTERPKETSIPLYKVENGMKICTATVEEIASAEIFLIKSIQHAVFLKNGALRNDMKMKKLSPFIDENGLVRARGRIEKSNVGEETRRPIILPNRHYLTDLIIESEHRRNAHTGQDTILNNLRKRFWIIDGRQAIRRCWTRCNFCRIQRAKPVIPEMGVLPSCRLASGHHPFTYTGVDYFGPVEVTVGRRHEKRWGVLFCCMVTRAVHLEIAHGLSTDETILALSRFIDSRRRPHTIFSDNGTNFHGAIKELERAISSEKYQKIMTETGVEKIRWSFIPPAAAHMGGAWERLIQAVKKVLKNSLHEKFPRDTVLLTAMKAAENIVNSRPMTYISADVDDPGVLTPNHFVKGGIDLGPSIPSEVESRATYFREKWREAQAIANEIWKRWTDEYLPTLLQRKKWLDQVEPLDIGDLVLIVDDQLPRCCWVKAVVTATFPGKDGQVRAVEVTTRNFTTKKKTTLKRPVTKLCPLGLKVGKSDVMTSNLGAGNVEK